MVRGVKNGAAWRCVHDLLGQLPLLTMLLWAFLLVGIPVSPRVGWLIPSLSRFLQLPSGEIRSPFQAALFLKSSDKCDG